MTTSETLCQGSESTKDTVESRVALLRTGSGEISDSPSQLGLRVIGGDLRVYIQALSWKILIRRYEV